MPRIDQALVERGLCESREKAKRAILAGLVKINRQSAHDFAQPVIGRRFGPARWLNPGCCGLDSSLRGNERVRHAAPRRTASARQIGDDPFRKRKRAGEPR